MASPASSDHFRRNSSALSQRASTAITTSSHNHRFESQSTLSYESCTADVELRSVRSQGGREYTVKCLKTRSRQDSLSAGTVPLSREAEIHAAVSGHPHILPYRDCFIVDGHYHGVFDACRGGHLGAHVQASQRFFQRDDEIKRVFLQLVSAVQHCHELGIAHRDLRPENFLAGDYRGQTYYLANFDHATTQRRSCRLEVGTRPYMSPGASLLATRVFTPTYVHARCTT
jgi:serine/threonine protein kinase